MTSLTESGAERLEFSSTTPNKAPTRNDLKAAPFRSSSLRDGEGAEAWLAGLLAGHVPTADVPDTPRDAEAIVLAILDRMNW